jgi:arginyl-tRNA synthetase
MLAVVKRELAERLSSVIRGMYGVELDPVLEIPPRRELGDLAAPVALHLARELKKAPRAIAAEVLEALELPELVERSSIEGPGYLNFFLDRATAARIIFEGALSTTAEGPSEEALAEKVVVEHTNINPNKAAHIGHLRNAVLGDVLAATLRAVGYTVEVQNYIDDTGVQLADVVVGLMDLRGLDLPGVEAVPEPFDFYCWDLYAEVGRWLEDSPEKLELRRETLHAMEANEGERAEMARYVGQRVVHRHLKTMRRLGIGYDLLTHESEILRLEFFQRAFERLKETGAVRHETEGRNENCWVMPLADSPEFEGLEDPDKVIVRSDGTVTYVGKDIAYQLWKFGLLGFDFEYSFIEEEGLWQTTEADGGGVLPSFGGADRVINVIDARQSYLQKIVRAGLQSLGHQKQAEESIHFAYEMVALSASAAKRLGVDDEGNAEGKGTLMSGRKGIGVKADDLLDELEEKARQGIAERNRELDDETLERLSHQIAIAALRFLMVKATTSRVIHFDFDEALNFEGETGPYLQYSLVREGNIRRRLQEAGRPSELAAEQVAALSSELWQDDLWDMVLAVAQIPAILESAARSLELSLLARHAIGLARRFHSIYHKHPILQEEDEALRTVRLATATVFRKGLGELLEILGIPVPERM